MQHGDSTFICFMKRSPRESHFLCMGFLLGLSRALFFWVQMPIHPQLHAYAVPAVSSVPASPGIENWDLGPPGTNHHSQGNGLSWLARLRSCDQPWHFMGAESLFAASWVTKTNSGRGMGSRRKIRTQITEDKEVNAQRVVTRMQWAQACRVLSTDPSVQYTQ